MLVRCGRWPQGNSVVLCSAGRHDLVCMYKPATLRHSKRCQTKSHAQSTSPAAAAIVGKGLGSSRCRRAPLAGMVWQVLWFAAVVVCAFLAAHTLPSSLHLPLIDATPCLTYGRPQGPHAVTATDSAAAAAGSQEAYGGQQQRQHAGVSMQLPKPDTASSQPDQPGRVQAGMLITPQVVGVNTRSQPTAAAAGRVSAPAMLQAAGPLTRQQAAKEVVLRLPGPAMSVLHGVSAAQHTDSHASSLSETFGLAVGQSGPQGSSDPPTARLRLGDMAAAFDADATQHGERAVIQITETISQVTEFRTDMQASHADADRERPAAPAGSGCAAGVTSEGVDATDSAITSLCMLTPRPTGRPLFIPGHYLTTRSVCLRVCPCRSKQRGPQ